MARACYSNKQHSKAGEHQGLHSQPLVAKLNLAYSQLTIGGWPAE